jgi:hypothetical protein
VSIVAQGFPVPLAAWQDGVAARLDSMCGKPFNLRNQLNSHVKKKLLA